MAVFEPEPATDTELVAAHTEYIAKVRAVSSLGGFLAESTYLSPGSRSLTLGRRRNQLLRASCLGVSPVP